jgi:hypothetical protein
MTAMLTKEDLNFITTIMDAPKIGLLSESDDNPTKDNKVQGDMDIPTPVSLDQQGTMTVEEYNKCAMVMSVCQNMVQKSITDAARVAGVDAAVALKDMNAWVTGYVNFPFPFFNFKDSQSNNYKNDEFSIDADPDFVDKIVNLKGVDGLKDAVVGALRKKSGNLASYSNTEKDFKYFGVITTYNSTEIATRVIKFSMNMKQTDVKSLCGGVSKTHLDSNYDTFQFVGDKSLMIKMQEKMGDKMADYFAEQLLEFIKNFYDSQLKEYEQNLVELLRKK